MGAVIMYMYGFKAVLVLIGIGWCIQEMGWLAALFVVLTADFIAETHIRIDKRSKEKSQT